MALSSGGESGKLTYMKKVFCAGVSMWASSPTAIACLMCFLTCSSMRWRRECHGRHGKERGQKKES